MATSHIGLEQIQITDRWNVKVIARGYTKIRVLLVSAQAMTGSKVAHDFLKANGADPDEVTLDPRHPKTSEFMMDDQIYKVFPAMCYALHREAVPEELDMKNSYWVRWFYASVQRYEAFENEGVKSYIQKRTLELIDDAPDAQELYKYAQIAYQRHDVRAFAKAALKFEMNAPISFSIWTSDPEYLDLVAYRGDNNEELVWVLKIDGHLKDSHKRIRESLRDDADRVAGYEKLPDGRLLEWDRFESKHSTIRSVWTDRLEEGELPEDFSIMFERILRRAGDDQFSLHSSRNVPPNPRDREASSRPDRATLTSLRKENAWRHCSAATVCRRLWDACVFLGGSAAELEVYLPNRWPFRDRHRQPIVLDEHEKWASDFQRKLITLFYDEYCRALAFPPPPPDSEDNKSSPSRTGWPPTPNTREFLAQRPQPVNELIERLDLNE